MMTPEELDDLRRRYGVNALQYCSVCGKPMKLRNFQPPGQEPAYECYRSQAKKYSKEWWDHVEKSRTLGGEQKDPTVIKLIEAYEELKK